MKLKLKQLKKEAKVTLSEYDDELYDLDSLVRIDQLLKFMSKINKEWKELDCVYRWGKAIGRKERDRLDKKEYNKINKMIENSRKYKDIFNICRKLGYNESLIKKGYEKYAKIKPLEYYNERYEAINRD